MDITFSQFKVIINRLSQSQSFPRGMPDLSKCTVFCYKKGKLLDKERRLSCDYFGDLITFAGIAFDLD